MGLWENAPTRMKAFAPAKTLDEANAQIKELQNLVAIAFKNIENIVNGNIDSRNTREIGGWKIDLTEMKSKDGDVGMSTEDTPADDVRYWAGDSDKNAAPWRVNESGKMHATGAVIESASGYPKVEIDPSTNRIAAWESLDNGVYLTPGNGTDPAGLIFQKGEVDSTYLIYSTSSRFRIENTNGIELVSGAGPIYIGSSLSAYGVIFPSWGDIKSTDDSQSLQSALNAKATSGASTGSAGLHDHGIASGVKLATTSDGSTVSGYVTWVPSGIHSHLQS